MANLNNFVKRMKNKQRSEDDQGDQDIPNPGKNKNLRDENEQPNQIETESDEYQTESDSNSNRYNDKKKRKVFRQHFKKEWSNKFTWLEEKEMISFCRYCSRKIEGGYSHLKRHDKTAYHIKKMNTLKQTVNISQHLKNDQQEKFKISVKKGELKLLMLIVEHNLALLSMDHIPKLIASVAPDSSIAKEMSCSRTKATNLLKNFQLENEAELTGILQNQKFSVIVDETTDIEVHKCLAVLVRYLDFKELKVRDRLLALVEIKDGKAETVFQAILDTIKRLSIPTSNLIGLVADNAAVMMGNNTGLKVKLMEINKNIVVIGCICHSVHLCASEAANCLPKQVEDFVRDIYNYFKNSTKRLQQFRECQEFASLKPHKMLRPCQTRWLSLEAVVNRLLEQWPAMILFFTSAAVEDNLVAAQTILNALNNDIYKLYLTFLSYTLSLVNKINVEFQSEKCQIHVLYSKTVGLLNVILKNFMHKSCIDSQEFTEINIKNAREYLPLVKIYLGAGVQLLLLKTNISDKEKHNFFLKCLNYYVELAAQIKKRFKNLDFYKPFECLEPCIVLSGEGSLIQLLNHLESFYDKRNIEDINTEYRQISELPKELKQTLKNVDFETFWIEICTLKNEINVARFPYLSNFMKDILSLPHSSAAAERIFSQLNLIKTKLRNRLLPETCNALLQAKEILGSQHCFNWEPSSSLLRRNVQY